MNGFVRLNNPDDWESFINNLLNEDLQLSRHIYMHDDESLVVFEAMTVTQTKIVKNIAKRFGIWMDNFKGQEC